MKHFFVFREAPFIFQGKYLAWLAKKKDLCVNDPTIMLKDCPREYRTLYDYFVSMNYSDKPDYDKCRSVLSETMMRKNFKDSDPLDWEPEADLVKLATAGNETISNPTSQ